MTNLLTLLEVADLLKEQNIHGERSRQRKDKFSILSQDSQNFKFLCTLNGTVGSGMLVCCFKLYSNLQLLG